MGLHVRDFESPSDQNKNSGNGGDLIKHSVYLAVLDVVRASRRAVHVVEGHAGKGVYVPAAEEYGRVANNRGARRSVLGIAQGNAFRPPPNGLGPIEGARDAEYAYAASAVLHAFALRDLPDKSLLLMDRDPDATATLTHLIGEPAFLGFDPRPRVLCTESPSEEVLLDGFQRSRFGEDHIVHVDPFAFVTSKEHARDRERYAKLLRTADRCVASKRLAALSVFIVWGRRHGCSARADLVGAGCGVENGYQDLRALIGRDRRVVVEWCWGQYFSMLMVVPSGIREQVIERITDYCKPFTPFLGGKWPNAGKRKGGHADGNATPETPRRAKHPATSHSIAVRRPDIVGDSASWLHPHPADQLDIVLGYRRQGWSRLDWFKPSLENSVDEQASQVHIAGARRTRTILGA